MCHVLFERPKLRPCITNFFCKGLNETIMEINDYDETIITIKIFKFS